MELSFPGAKVRGNESSIIRSAAYPVDNSLATLSLRLRHIIKLVSQLVAEATRYGQNGTTS